MAGLTLPERLTCVETKLDSIEESLKRIESAITEKLRDHETRLGVTERKVDRVQWLAGAAITCIGLLATILVIADKLNLLP